MASFSIPDPDDRLTVAGPAQWRRRAAAMSQIATQAQWWVGDFLNAAPTVEDWADFLKSDPRFCSREITTAIVVAQRFPPDTRRATLPWSFHAATYDLPAAARAELLDAAEAERMSIEQVRQAAADWRAGHTTGPADQGALFALLADDTDTEAE